MDYPDDFSGRVRFALSLLDAHGWTGAAIAREAGVNAAQVSRWRDGALPEDERALARLLRVEPALVRYGPLAELRARSLPVAAEGAAK